MSESNLTQTDVKAGKTKRYKLYVLTLTAAITMMAMSVTVFASGSSVPTIDLTGVNLNGILDGVVAMIPQVMPVIVGFLAIRKGISFLMSSLRGA